MTFYYNKCKYHNLNLEGLPLHLKHVYARHPNASKDYSLQDISLHVHHGTCVALVGPNGAGKSTLLKIAAGFLPFQKGTLTVFNHPPGSCHHQVAYLPQQSQIDWNFPITLERFVLTGRYVHLGWLKRPKKEDWDKLDTILKQLELCRLRKRHIDELSGGERQRALLARTLLHDANLLLLDEPLNAVDHNTRIIVEKILKKLKKEQKTVIMATHDIGRLESDFDQAFFLNDGRLVEAPPGAPPIHFCGENL